MGVLGDIKGFVAGSGSVFMILILAVADHLWGENVFNCPCGGQRLLYTSAFLVAPPALIIVIDVSWRLLCNTVAENCCGKADRDDVEGGQRDSGVEGRKADRDDKSSSGRCHCTCFTETCCDCRTCETVVRLTARPVIIAIVWLVFSCMEPKFGNCIFKTSSCMNEDEEKASFLRVITAVTMLSITAVVVTGGGLCLVCWSCVPCIKRRCCKQSVDAWVGKSETRSNRELTRVLYTMGLKPKTVINLRNQGLMNERLLLRLSEDSLKALATCISVGQLEILRVHRGDIRLIGWLLGRGYSEGAIRRVLDRPQSFKTIDPVRETLNSGNIPTDVDAGALADELSRRSILTRSKAREVPVAQEASESI